MFDRLLKKLYQFRVVLASLGIFALVAAPALAHLSVNNLTGFNIQQAGGLDPFELTFGTSAVNAGNSGSGAYSFSTQNVGADATAPNVRYTVVAVEWLGGTMTVTSATFCGVSATQVTSQANANIWIADTTGQGTTCTIAFQLSGSAATSGAIGVWRMINPASSTATDTAVASGGGAGARTLDLDIPSGGAAVGAILCASSSAKTFTWTSGEDYDATVESSSSFHSGAHISTPGTPTTFTVTPSSSCSSSGASSASWSP